MKLPIFSSKVSHKPLLIRRVVGQSMMPSLQPGQIVLATNLLPIRSGDIVVATIDGREVIKRVAELRTESAGLRGDNQSASTDSRVYGPLPWQNLYGRVIITSARKKA